MINKIILKDFIYTCESKTEEKKYPVFLDTMDESFPEEFRYRCISMPELFCKIRKAEKDYLLDKSIESMYMTPYVDDTETNINKLIDDFSLYIGTGGCYIMIPTTTIVRNYATETETFETKFEKMHFMMVLKLVLEK